MTAAELILLPTAPGVYHSRPRVLSNVRISVRPFGRSWYGSPPVSAITVSHEGPVTNPIATNTYRKIAARLTMLRPQIDLTKYFAGPNPDVRLYDEKSYIR